MKSLSCICVLLFASTLLAQDKLSDWAQFRGPKGLGISPDKGLPTTWSEKENLAWKTKLPGPGTSSPIVVGDRIYLTCYTGYNVPGERGNMDDLKRLLVCLDRKSGEVKWKKEVAAALPEQERIRDDHGYASSTLAIDKDHLYCFFGKSGVYAFTHEGKEVWHEKVGDRLNGWGSAASPVLHKDLVIINASVESNTMVALNRKTGKQDWKATGITEAWNTPLLVPLKGDKMELVVGINNRGAKILGLDPDTGKQNWSCGYENMWYVVPSLVAEGDLICGISGRSGTLAVAVRAGGSGDVTKSHRVWTGEKGSNVSSPILHEGLLYWASDSQEMVYCADAKTGEIKYQQRVGRLGTVYASPVLADGKLYYISREGQMLVLAAGPKYEKLATNRFDDRSIFHASPAVAGGKLYVRSDRYLYCIEKK